MAAFVRQLAGAKAASWRGDTVVWWLTSAETWKTRSEQTAKPKPLFRGLMGLSVDGSQRSDCGSNVPTVGDKYPLKRLFHFTDELETSPSFTLNFVFCRKMAVIVCCIRKIHIFWSSEKQAHLLRLWGPIMAPLFLPNQIKKIGSRKEIYGIFLPN